MPLGTIRVCRAMVMAEAIREEDKQMAESLDQVIDRVQAGDHDAFGELLKPYRNKAFGLCYSIVRNTEDAKDILQISFIKAYHNIGAFRRGSSFYTWLYRIVVNSAKDHLRQKTHGSTLPLENISGEYSTDEEGLLQKELKEKLNAAIAKLSEKQQLVFVMKHVNGMKIKEISQILHCAPSTVKIHLFRAVRSLQKMLSPYLSVEGGV